MHSHEMLHEQQRHNTSSLPPSCLSCIQTHHPETQRVRRLCMKRQEITARPEVHTHCRAGGFTAAETELGAAVSLHLSSLLLSSAPVTLSQLLNIKTEVTGPAYTSCQVFTLCMSIPIHAKETGMPCTTADLKAGLHSCLFLSLWESKSLRSIIHTLLTPAKWTYCVCRSKWTQLQSWQRGNVCAPGLLNSHRPSVYVRI